MTEAEAEAVRLASIPLALARAPMSSSPSTLLRLRTPPLFGTSCLTDALCDLAHTVSSPTVLAFDSLRPHSSPPSGTLPPFRRPLLQHHRVLLRLHLAHLWPYVGAVSNMPLPSPTSLSALRSASSSSLVMVVRTADSQKWIWWIKNLMQ